MITLNSLSLLVGIVAGLIAIYSHIRLNKLTPEQAKAYAEESIKAMYPDMDILYHDYKSEKEASTQKPDSEVKTENVNIK